MKKVIFGDFTEYNSKDFKLGNYHYCNCFVNDGYEALWISNAFNHLIYFKDKMDFRYKKSISSAHRHKLAEHIYGFAAYSIRLYGNYPFSRNPKILERMDQTIIPNVRNSLRKMDFQEVEVLWISTPKMYWLTKVVNYKTLIYRIADDYNNSKDFPNIAVIDALLIKKATLVVIASSTLEQHVLDYGITPLLLSNGVVFEHFNQSGVACPVEYRREGRKRIVYVGALKHWFDTELLQKLAEQVEADIYLIGPCETDLSRLEKFDNIFILGSRRYELLPGYLQHADVALIPFVKSPMTDSISPIKLYEYCSAGVAVVSSNMRETAKLKAPIWLAEDHEDFIAGVKHYLSEAYDRSELRDFGRSNSWDQRYQQLNKALLE